MFDVVKRVKIFNLPKILFFISFSIKIIIIINRTNLLLKSIVHYLKSNIAKRNKNNLKLDIYSYNDCLDLFLELKIKNIFL